MVEPGEFRKLEEALIEAGHAIEYPPTPDLAAHVRAELKPDRLRQLDRARWRPAFVVALAVIAALALLLIIPETREAIAQLLESAHHSHHRSHAYTAAAGWAAGHGDDGS
jgi:hypothetical protein